MGRYSRKGCSTRRWLSSITGRYSCGNTASHSSGSRLRMALPMTCSVRQRNSSSMLTGFPLPRARVSLALSRSTAPLATPMTLSRMSMRSAGPISRRCCCHSGPSDVTSPLPRMLMKGWYVKPVSLPYWRCLVWNTRFSAAGPRTSTHSLFSTRKRTHESPLATSQLTKMSHGVPASSRSACPSSGSAPGARGIEVASRARATRAQSSSSASALPAAAARKITTTARSTVEESMVRLAVGVLRAAEARAGVMSSPTEQLI
mmetsp:Transcript_33218/g.84876  ORF Transcript_33218/g.84876 Transcript_33218/m.84876 type:complete len:260 (+) Transcript_33218:850-1629(+)